MATVALTASPTTIDDGTSYSVLVTNTGAVTVDLSRGGRLRPGQSLTVYPEGQALTAATTSGTGSVTTVATATVQSQAQQVAANTAAIAGLPNTYVPILQAATTYTYNADGTVATETSGGITTTYGYTNGKVTSISRGGVTRTVSYNSDGTIASVA